MSSCLSCHSVAEQTKAEKMLPSGSSDQEKLHWFRNLAPLEPFDNDGQHKSLDFSLQLAVGIDNQSHSAAAHPFLHFFLPKQSSISRDPRNNSENNYSARREQHPIYCVSFK